MKKIKKILIFVLCAFAVLFTVGFSNVKAVIKTVKYQEGNFTATEGVIKSTGYEDLSYVCNINNGISAPKILNGDIYLKPDKASGETEDGASFEIIECPDGGVIDSYNISLGVNKVNDKKAYTAVYLKKDINDPNEQWYKSKGYNLNGNKNIEVYNLSSNGYKYLKIVNTSYYDAESESIIKNVEVNYKVDVVEYSVNFETFGGSAVPTQMVGLNKLANAPTNPISEGRTFLGWYTSQSFEESTKFSFETPITQDITLYAKWETPAHYNFVNSTITTSLKINYTSTTLVGEKKFTEVTSSQSDWTGQYVIAYKNGSAYELFNPNDNNPTGTKNYIRATLENGAISVVEANTACVVDIAKDETSGYTIKANGKYLGNDKSSNGINFDSKARKVQIDYSNGIEIKSGSSTLQFFKQNGSEQFKFYTSDQQPIKLFKYDSGSKTEYDVANVDLRFGIMMTETDYNAMVDAGALGFGISLKKANGNEQTFDFELYNPENTGLITQVEKVNANGIADSEGTYYQFSVVLTEVPAEEYGVNVTGYAYVLIDDIYMTKSKTSSVKGTAQDYLNLSDQSQFETHLGVLKELAK